MKKNLALIDLRKLTNGRKFSKLTKERQDKLLELILRKLQNAQK